MFHTHLFIYHPRCIMFSSQNLSFPCQYHSNNAPYSFIHLPSKLCNVFLPALQFPLSVSFPQCSKRIYSSTTDAVYSFSPSTSVSPVSIIPPMLHTHSCIYHPRCIMFSSQNFSFPCQYHSKNAPYSFIHLPSTLCNVFLPALQFPLSVSFPQCSILIYSSTTDAVYSFSPSTSVSPVSIIPPTLHTRSFIYHRRCIMFFSQYFSFPCQYHSTNTPYSFIYLPPTLYNAFLPVLHFPLSVSFHQYSILIHSSTIDAV